MNNDINNKLYEFVESLVRQNLRQKYNNNYPLYMVENGMLILFVEQNKELITSANVRNAIINNVSNDEYLTIVDKVRREIVKQTSTVQRSDNQESTQKLDGEQEKIPEENIQNQEDDNQIMTTEKENVKTLKPVFTKNNQGFSNALILAFIIGSFIGIVFLNIYSKFMR